MPRNLVASGFVCYVTKRKNERGTLCTNLDAFPLAGRGRSSNLVVSVKIAHYAYIVISQKNWPF